jgi:hypothetical protein
MWLTLSGGRCPADVRPPFYRRLMIIDCGTCVNSPAAAADASACADCVVSVLLGMPDGLAPTAEIADEHEAAVAVLAESGLIPPLRLVQRSQAS